MRRNLRHGSVEGKTAEDDNAKINIFPNILCTFLLFKAGAFLQILFSEKIEVLRTSVFFNNKCLTLLRLLAYFFNWTKEHPLETSNKITYIPLLINLFISLIELEHPLKISNKRIHV